MGIDAVEKNMLLSWIPSASHRSQVGKFLALVPCCCLKMLGVNTKSEATMVLQMTSFRIMYLEGIKVRLHRYIFGKEIRRGNE